MGLLFLGDMSFNNRISVNINNNINLPFEYIERSFKEYSEVIGNLESPLTNNNQPIRDKITLKSTGNTVKLLRQANIMNISIANNHILDYGYSGYISTKRYIVDEGLNCFGDVKTPYIQLNYKEKKIAVLGLCSYDTNPLYSVDDNEVLDKVNYNYIKKQVTNMIEKDFDYIIAYIHWGDEYLHYPNKSQQQIARMLIDNGIDMVIGHHPHIVQNIEKYKNKQIFYSLGNFIFDNIKSESRGIVYKSKLFFANRWSIGIHVDIENDTLIIKDLEIFFISKLSQVLSVKNKLIKIIVKIQLRLINVLSRCKIFVLLQYKTLNIKYMIRNYLSGDDKNIFSCNNLNKIISRVKSIKKN